MTQRDRDRLVALKKARKGLITQRQAAEEIGQSERERSKYSCGILVIFEKTAETTVAA